MSHKKLGITKEIMATKIIPFLMPLSIENGLTLNQVIFSLTFKHRRNFEHNDTKLRVKLLFLHKFKILYMSSSKFDLNAYCTIVLFKKNCAHFFNI